MTENEIEKFRAYTIVGYSLMNVLVVLICLPIVLVLRLDWIDNLAGLGVLAAVAINSYWTLKTLRITGSTLISGNVCMLMMFVVIFAACHITGGLSYSPFNIFLTTIPLFGFLLAGFYSGIAWASLVLFMQSVGVFAEQNATNDAIQLLGTSALDQFYLLAPSLMVIVAALAIIAFEMTNKELTRQLNKERSRYSYKATHDSLTGLSNRKELNSCLSIAVNTAKFNKSNLSTLCYLDLDGFKAINDNMGHHAGDDVLKVIASRLLSVTRSSDFVARFGGDEFAVVLTGAACREDLIPVLSNILTTVREPIIIDGKEVSVSTSIGVSVCPEDAEDEHQMARQADMALYEAKKQKNDFCFYRDIRDNDATPIHG